MKKFSTLLVLLCIGLPFSQAANAASFKKCSMLIIDLELAVSKALGAAWKKACKTGDAANASRKGAKVYNRAVTRWNTQGKKQFDKERCDPDLGLDAGDFAQPTATEADFLPAAEQAAAICDGVLTP